ncbi:hypothetical protein GGI05_002552, partial [Coemansia sp. RSA 2603]
MLVCQACGQIVGSDDVVTHRRACKVAGSDHESTSSRVPANFHEHLNEVNQHLACEGLPRLRTVEDLRNWHELPEREPIDPVIGALLPGNGFNCRDCSFCATTESTVKNHISAKRQDFCVYHETTPTSNRSAIACKIQGIKTSTRMQYFAVNDNSNAATAAPPITAMDQSTSNMQQQQSQQLSKLCGWPLTLNAPSSGMLAATDSTCFNWVTVLRFSEISKDGMINEMAQLAKVSPGFGNRGVNDEPWIRALRIVTDYCLVDSNSILANIDESTKLALGKQEMDGDGRANRVMFKLVENMKEYGLTMFRAVMAVLKAGKHDDYSRNMQLTPVQIDAADRLWHMVNSHADHIIRIYNGSNSSNRNSSSDNLLTLFAGDLGMLKCVSAFWRLLILLFHYHAETGPSTFDTFPVVRIIAYLSWRWGAFDNASCTRKQVSVLIYWIRLAALVGFVCVCRANTFSVLPANAHTNLVGLLNTHASQISVDSKTFIDKWFDTNSEAVLRHYASFLCLKRTCPLGVLVKISSSLKRAAEMDAGRTRMEFTDNISYLHMLFDDKSLFISDIAQTYYKCQRALSSEIQELTGDLGLTFKITSDSAASMKADSLLFPIFDDDAGDIANTIRDNRSASQTYGLFINMGGNTYWQYETRLLKWLMATANIGHLTALGQLWWNKSAVNQWCECLNRIGHMVYFLMHLGGGQPVRGTEFTRILISNVPQSVRTLLINKGMFAYYTHSCKALVAESPEAYVAHFLPRDHANLVLKYLVLIRPCQRALEQIGTDSEERKNSIRDIYSTYLCVDNGKLCTGDMFTRLFAKIYAEFAVGPKLLFNDYRHAIRSFITKIAPSVYSKLHVNTPLDPLGKTLKQGITTYGSDSILATIDRQTGHSRKTAETDYAISNESTAYMVASIEARFYMASAIHHIIFADNGISSAHADDSKSLAHANFATLVSTSCQSQMISTDVHGTLALAAAAPKSAFVGGKSAISRNSTSNSSSNT